MARTAKSFVDSKLDHSQPDPDTRPTTPEPTTASGVQPEHALYDISPSEGAHSSEWRSGRRKRRSTSRGESYVVARNRAEDIREKGNWTRKRNNALRARIAEPSNSNNERAEQPTSQQPTSQQPARGQQRARGPLREKTHRGRSRTTRHLSRSPTPGSTDHELEPEDSTRPVDSQPTNVYETLSNEALFAHAREVLGEDFASGSVGTQAVLERLRDAPRNKALEVGPSRKSSSIVVLPGEPLQLGGGWHHGNAEPSPSVSRGKKRTSDAEDGSQGSAKRARSSANHPATEPETDDEPTHATAARMVEACGVSFSQRPGPHLPPAPPPPSLVSEPVPPSRESTPTTVLDSTLSFTQFPSIGADSSHWGQHIPPLPMLLSAPRGPTHDRLKEKSLQRFIDAMERDAGAADAAEIKAAEAAEAAKAAQHDVEMDGSVPTETEEVRETNLGAPHSSPAQPRQASDRLFDQSTAPRSQRTYRGTRSHAPSPTQFQLPEPSTAAGDDVDDEDTPLPGPNSPRLTWGDQIRRERARMVAAKLDAELRDSGVSRPRPRPRPLFAQATEPPTSRPQARPPPAANASASASGARVSGTRRLDPISAARNDMIRFNEACAQERATSFIQSATRRTERAPQRPAPVARPLDELLPDNEEDLAESNAHANNRWPDRSPHSRAQSPASRGRIRKPKPTARDVSGVDRQNLTIAKIHLFAYGLVQGIYQTRATFLRWAAAVHEATWEMELPTTPYVRPDNDVFEVMVNNLATLRGRVKERVRLFVETEAGFRHTTNNEEIIQENLRRFNLRYPNAFHCKSFSPRRGHFESAEIGHCIAVLLFHGPNSVGMLYPDYFKEMPLTAVAFALAMWMFGLEEWQKGWQQNGDLGMASMREKYESLLTGLKDLRDIAPRRVQKLQREWRDYVEEYSGACLQPPKEGEAGGETQRSEMRPDTPEPEDRAISVDEMNEELFETARQASLRERTHQLLVRHGVRADDAADEDAEQDDVEVIPRPTTPPPEINEQGRLTARSKGKGRAS